MPDDLLDRLVSRRPRYGRLVLTSAEYLDKDHRYVGATLVDDAGENIVVVIDVVKSR